MDPVRKGIEDALEGPGGEPLFGRGRKAAAPPFPPDTEYRYFKGNLDHAEAKAELERLMTRSMRCQAELKKPGDVCVIAESGTFDKEGGYTVVLKYLCIPDCSPETKSKSPVSDASTPAAIDKPVRSPRRTVKNKAEASDPSPKTNARTRRKNRA